MNIKIVKNIFQVKYLLFSKNTAFFVFEIEFKSSGKYIDVLSNYF